MPTTQRISSTRFVWFNYPWRDRRGAAAIEFGVLVRLFLLGAIEFGRVLAQSNAVEKGVRGGVALAVRGDNPITAVQAVFSDIGNTNVQVGYVASGIDDADNDEIVTALVTVNLTGVTHSFIVLDIVPGVPSSITYPAFSTSALRATEVITPP